MTDMYQFGFKKGHSTGLCTNIVKRTVDYYLKHGSHVFACFVDFSKAFDRVNYWKLFSRMMDEGSDVCFVSLLAYWYSNQMICVGWQGLYSEINLWLGMVLNRVACCHLIYLPDMFDH